MVDRTSGSNGTPGRSAATGVSWLAIAAVAYIAFAILAVLVVAHVAIPFDQPLFDTMHSWTSLTPLWEFVSASANYPLIAIGVGIVVWLLYRRNYRDAIVVIAILVAATAGSEAVKQLVHRPRPLGTDPRVLGVVYSFPSGHTLEAMTIYGIIAFHVWRGRWSRPVRTGIVVALAAAVLLVGVARIAIGEHFPSDVLAGLLVGTGDLALYAWATHGRGTGRNENPETDNRIEAGAT